MVACTYPCTGPSPRVSDACNIATNKRNWHSLQMELIPKVAKLIDQPVNNRNGKHEWKRDSFEWMWKSNRDFILFFLLGNRHLDGGLYCLRLCCSYWVHSGDLIDYETFWYCKIIIFNQFQQNNFTFDPFRWTTFTEGAVVQGKFMIHWIKLIS